MAYLQLLTNRQCDRDGCTTRAVAIASRDDRDSEDEYVCGPHAYDFLNAQGVDPLEHVFDNA